MSIGEIETLEIGTKVSCFCENVREVRTIEKHPFEDSLIARSSYGTYMPISKETQEKYKIMRIIKWEDGYPMEESLEELKKVLNGKEISKAIDAFYEALKENYYRYDNCFGVAEVEIRGEKMRVWQYHTVGWSGNEDIINTLKQSWLWDILLERYDRGGHYYFTPQKS